MVDENGDGTGSPVEYEGAYMCCPSDDPSCSASCSWIDFGGDVTDEQARGDYGGEGSRTIPGGCT